MMMRITAMLVFLAATAMTFAQATVPDQVAVSARFESPASVKWVEAFRGTWQGFHPVEMILGYDGQEYHGTMLTENSQVRFDLYGTDRDGSVMLQEIDTTGRTSGYLQLTIRDGRIEGHWWSVDFSRSAELSLRSNAVVALRRFEPEMLHLSGSMIGKPASLFVLREEPDLLSGFCTLSTGAFYRISGKCIDAACDRMELEFVSADQTSLRVMCTRQRGEGYQIQPAQGASHTLRGTMDLIREYGLRIERHYDYSGTVDCVYPLLSIPSFDAWITGLMQDWFHRTELEIQKLNVSAGTPGPSERWIMRASAWTDLTLVNAEKVSGILTMYDPAKRAYERRAFLFDIKSGKAETVQDLARRSDFTTQLSDHAAAQHPGSGPAHYPHIALSAEGFVLFTGFDHIHGDNWFLLPYEDYVDDLKRNTIIHALLK